MLYPLVFIGLCYFFLMPVCDSDIERPDLLPIIAEIMDKPYSRLYHSLFPYCKLLWALCLVAGICGWNSLFSILSIVMTVGIGIFDAMGDSEEWEFVWVVSNSVSILFITGYFVYEILAQQNNLRFCNLHKSRLWLLPLIIFLFWCPVKQVEKDIVWDFSLHAFLYNYAGTSFCHVGPTLLAVLLLFYPHVNRRLVGISTAVCSLYGVFSVGAHLWSHQMPLVVMHLPLLVVSIYGYYLYFSPVEAGKAEEKEEKEKEE